MEIRPREPQLACIYSAANLCKRVGIPGTPLHHNNSRAIQLHDLNGCKFPSLQLLPISGERSNGLWPPASVQQLQGSGIAARPLAEDPADDRKGRKASREDCQGKPRMMRIGLDNLHCCNPLVKQLRKSEEKMRAILRFWQDVLNGRLNDVAPALTTTQMEEGGGRRCFGKQVSQANAV